LSSFASVILSILVLSSRRNIQLFEGMLNINNQCDECDFKKVNVRLYYKNYKSSVR